MTASLENCRRLYNLSGWDDCEFSWKYGSKCWQVPSNTRPIGEGDNTPLYDSDYLLEKLPQEAHAGDISVRWRSDTGWENWEAGYMNLRYVSDTEWYVGDTPADALCLLAIKLFEDGILKRKDGENE